MKTKTYLKEIEKHGEFGHNNASQIILAISELDESINNLNNASQIILAISELDESINNLNHSLKEIPKQLKYFWQTLDELKEEKSLT